jgi:hypothetical protein
MPDQHAFLSASSSNRWIACPPSAKLNSQTGGQTSEYAILGTCAHSLAEYKLKKALGRKARDPTNDLDCYDLEMESATDDYVAYVLEQVQKEKETCHDPEVLVEQQLDLSRWIPESFGTADALVVGDDTLTIVDLKYGTGIKVESSSSQLKCYALGCVDMFDGIYDIRKVRMVIFQPRLEHISETEMSKEELLTWADEVLVPAAKLAFVGEGEFNAGDYCQFCSVKANCRKRAETNLELARFDFAMPPTLEDEEIEAILPKLDQLSSWASDIKDYVLQKALSGKKWPGFKLVEGRANRKYVNEDAVAEVVTAAGYDPFEKRLLGITAMTSLLGKKKFEEVLSGLVERPQGKPALVPQSDKRPEMNSAADDFKE